MPPPIDYDVNVSPPWEAKGATRREFIKGAAAVGAAIAALPLLSNEASASTVPPASGPGGMNSWQQSMPIYSGSVNLATGNGQLVLPICGWAASGISRGTAATIRRLFTIRRLVAVSLTA